MCDHFECEDVIASIDEVELACPVTRPRGESSLAQSFAKAADRLAGLKLQWAPKVAPVQLESSYELFFFRAASLRDLDLLRYVPGWRRQCRTAICWVDELWATQLEATFAPTSAVRSLQIRVLNEFDHVILPFAGTVEQLQEYIKAPVRWMPFAVDTLAFNPGPHPTPRTIDFFAMGRREASMHERIRNLARQRRWTYLYDTARVDRVIDPFVHRAHTIELAQRSKLFLANRAKVDRPQDTGAQHEMGFRFLEGAAAGAVLVGELPKSQAFESCFDWQDAAFELPADPRRLSDMLIGLVENPQRLERISRENIRQCLLRHDWAYRWDAILKLAGMRTRPSLHSRVEQLEHAALQVSGASHAPAARGLAV